MTLSLVRGALALSLFGSLVTAQSRAWFHAPVLLPTGAAPAELLLDLDGDGDVDAVGLDHIYDTMTVFTNDGFGNLDAGPLQTLSHDFAEGGMQGDFNGDGDPDLCLHVVGSVPNAGFLILPGGAGNTFGAPVFVQTPAFLLDIGVGDADGDAFADVYVRHYQSGSGDEHYWMHGSAGLTFTAGPRQFTSGNYHLVHDENGDGLDDVIRVQVASSGTSFTIERTSPAGIVPAYAVTPPVWGSWSMMDWDGDGQNEIVSPVLGSTVHVISHQGGQVWTPTTYTVMGGFHGRLFRADWNGDGTRELIAAGDGFELFEDLGNGSFASLYGLDVNAPLLQLSAGTVDLDGDGNLDFVGGRYVFHGDGTLDAPLGPGAHLPLGDWDNDGDLDAVGSQLAINDGTGKLAFELYDLPSSPTRFHMPLAVADFDGDGLREMLVRATNLGPFGAAYDGLYMLRENGDGAFAEVGPAAPAGVQFVSALLNDIDGDGDLDLLDEGGVHTNDGSEFFTLSVPWNYWPIAVEDMDGDGDGDVLAVSTAHVTSAVVIEQTGPGAFTPNVLFATAGSFAYRTDAAWVDVDDDGDLDVVAREQVGLGRTAIYTNQAGAFTFATTLAEAGRTIGGDFDGDGLTDLAIGGDSVVTIRRRQGPGLVYAPPVELPARNISEAADIDQDGDLDLIGNHFGSIVKNRRFHGEDAGRRRQYGEGSLGQGNRRPTLSFTGLLRETEMPSLRVRNIPGGALVLVVLGSGEDNTPSPFLAGVQSYVNPIDVWVAFQAGGPLGVAGLGTLDLPLTLPVGLAGARLYWEALVVDATGPIGLTHTNGCEMVVGQ